VALFVTGAAGRLGAADEEATERGARSRAVICEVDAAGLKECVSCAARPCVRVSDALAAALGGAEVSARRAGAAAAGRCAAARGAGAGARRGEERAECLLVHGRCVSC